MKEVQKLQRRINAVLSDDKYRNRGIECVVTAIPEDSDDYGENRFWYFWYFRSGGNKVGMPKVDQRPLDLDGIREMAKEVIWHHDDYNIKYGPKDSKTKRLLDRIFKRDVNNRDNGEEEKI